MKTAQLIGMLAMLCAFGGSLAFGAWQHSGAASAWMFLTLCAAGLCAAAMVAACRDRGRFY